MRKAFTAVPLLFVALISVLGLIVLNTGFVGLLMGLPLLILVSSWTARYALILIDHVGRGLEPPVLAIEMVNPLDARPLAALAWLGLALAGTLFAGRAALWAGALVALLEAALLPAALGVLALESWFLAFSPLHLLRTVRGLGPAYGVMLAATCIYGAGLAILLTHHPLYVALPAGLLGWVALALLYGAAWHHRREALGFDAWLSPERAEAKAAAIATRAKQRVLDEIYGLVRVRRLERAWQVAEEGLAQAGEDVEFCRWLRDGAAGWDEGSIAEGLTRRLVDRLLVLGRTGEALGELESWAKAGRRYRPLSGRELVRLVALARAQGRAELALRLLAEAGPLFPADPEVKSLMARAQGERTPRP
jgi:hypothetical protein